MFKLRPTKETPMTSTDPTTTNPDLPAGYDEEDSPSHVPAELRPYYVADPQDRGAPYSGDAEQWVYVRRLDAEVARLRAADPRTYGPLSRNAVVSSIQTPKNDTRWRALSEDQLTPDEAEAYVHQLRLERAAHAQRLEHDRVAMVALSTCQVCGDLHLGGVWAAVTERRLLDGRRVLADRDCATILDHLLRTQARGADGRTREQAAREWLTAHDQAQP